MSSKSNTARFIVGYALPQSKVQTCITHSLVSHALDRGVELIHVDLEKSLIDQGPFDCLIHKIRTPEWNSELLDFKLHHPDTVIIDHPESIEPLKNRISMLEVVPKLGIDNLGVPTQVLVSNAEDVSLAYLMGQLKLPLIAKPLYSDGSLISHEMCLVLNAEGLKVLEVKHPLVLQQFTNHGGVLFKVYVAGRHVKCVKRKSVPDIIVDDTCGDYGGGILLFSDISNLSDEKEREDQDGGDARLFGGRVNVSRLVEEAEMPHLSLVTEVAEGLRKALGLNLFNFDMIRDGGGGGGDTDRYLVIDINYFPGYAKVPGFEAMLTEFLLDVARATSEEYI